MFCYYCCGKFGTPTNKCITGYLEIRSGKYTSVRKHEYNVIACTRNITIGKSYGIFVSCVVYTYFGRAVLIHDLLFCVLIDTTCNVLSVIASVNHQIRCVIYCFAVCLHISVAIKRCHHMKDSNGNRFTNLPCSCETDVSCGHCLGNCRIPAYMSITGSFKYRSCANACAINIVFCNALEIVAAYILYSICISVVVNFIYVFGERIGNLIVYGDSVSEALFDRREKMFCKIKLFKRNCKEGFSDFLVGFTIHIHYLMNNSHFRTDCF